MTYNERLADRIRKAIEHLPNVEEKKMFRGVTFMVNGKMCVSVSGDEMMCRIDPILHETVVEKNGCRAMFMKGREYKGYVYISQEGMKSQKDFAYWLGLSIDFNPIAKVSKKNN